VTNPPARTPVLPASGQAIVVAFDMCSSSSIVDELGKAGNVEPLTAFFDELRRYLARQQGGSVEFELYKFVGDGWLLLFPANTNGERLLAFLEELCLFFAVAFRRSLLPHLSRTPRVVGVRFGMEKGDLVPITMDGKREYVGRPINVACRLQAALKDEAGSPAYSALMSNRVYEDYFADTTPHRVRKVSSRLRNVDDGAPFECRRIWLLRPFDS
jgi:class 3 adenylate cyclase